MAWAIITTILGCWPLGVVAIVKSASVIGKWMAGDYAGAYKAAAAMVRVPAMVGPLLVGAVGLTGVLMVATVSPHEPGNYPLCPSLYLTGTYCPGCGAMRAVHDLAHLNVAGAWGMNPLVVAAVPYLGPG